MSNATESILLAIAAYLALSMAVRLFINFVLKRRQIALPTQWFSPKKRAVLREAWTDAGLAFFGLAVIALSMQWSGLLVGLWLTCATISMGFRAACDSPRAQCLD